MQNEERQYYPVHAAMSLACTLLGISPQQFWKMSPPELYACGQSYALDGKAAPPTRAEIDEMARRFPD